MVAVKHSCIYVVVSSETKASYVANRAIPWPVVPRHGVPTSFTSFESVASNPVVQRRPIPIGIEFSVDKFLNLADCPPSLRLIAQAAQSRGDNRDHDEHSAQGVAGEFHRWLSYGEKYSG
jgi:hypothetical protein